MADLIHQFLNKSFRAFTAFCLGALVMMHSSLVMAQENDQGVAEQGAVEKVVEQTTTAPEAKVTKIASSAVIQSPADQILKMVVGLIVVLIIIFIIAWLAKNYMGFSPTSNPALKPIAAVAVGQKERVVLLKVSDRQVLIGVAPGNVSMLCMLDKESEVDVSSDTSKNLFAEKLKASMGKLEKS